MIAEAIGPIQVQLEGLALRIEEVASQIPEPEPEPEPEPVGWAEWYWAQHPDEDPRNMSLPTITVTSPADSGPGTLRDALSAGNRIVTFSEPMVITLASDIVCRYDNVIYDNSARYAVVTTNSVKFDGTGYVLYSPDMRDSKATSATDNLTLRGRSNGPSPVAIVYNPLLRRAADGALDIIYSRGKDVYVSIWDAFIAETDKALLIDSGEASTEGGRYFVTIGNSRWVDCGQRQPGARNAEVHLIDCVIERYGDHIGAGGGAKAFGGCNMLVENVTVIPRVVGETVGFNGQVCTKPRTEGVGPHLGSPGNVRAVNCQQGAPYIVERNPQLVQDPPYRQS